MGKGNDLSGAQDRLISGLADIGERTARRTDPLQQRGFGLINEGLTGLSQMGPPGAVFDASRFRNEVQQDFPGMGMFDPFGQGGGFSFPGLSQGPSGRGGAPQLPGVDMSQINQPATNASGTPLRRSGIASSNPPLPPIDKPDDFRTSEDMPGGQNQGQGTPDGTLTTGGQITRGSGGAGQGNGDTTNSNEQSPSGGGQQPQTNGGFQGPPGVAQMLGFGLPTVGQIAGQIPGQFGGNFDPLASATELSALNRLNQPVTPQDILNQQQGEITARLNLNNEAAGAGGRFGGSSNLIQNAMDIGGFTSRAQDIANQQNQLAFQNAMARQGQGFGQNLAGFGANLDRSRLLGGLQQQGFGQAQDVFNMNRNNALQNMQIQENLANVRQAQALQPLNFMLQALGLGQGGQQLQGALGGLNQSLQSNAQLQASSPLSQLAGALGGIGGQAAGMQLGRK